MSKQAAAKRDGWQPLLLLNDNAHTESEAKIIMSSQGDKKIDRPRKARRYQEHIHTTVDWAKIENEFLGEVISTVTATGCAIRFGYSRDRGAFAIGIVGDSEPYTVWAATEEELYIKLSNLIKSFKED